MAAGIIIVDKPADWTSHDVVAKLRGALHERRVGHGGTLDPMATGVLPVFAGRATRAVEFFESAEKEYLCTLRLGMVTDTDDTTGRVLSQQVPEVSEAALLEVLPSFVGPQDQLPPMYSAVKIHGKKLYELARAGVEAERTPRRIEIFELELRSFDGLDALLRVRCSKGTYIRTLCHDLGEALGCGGTMASLRRTCAGVYDLAQAHALEQVLADPFSCLLPVDSLFSDRPSLTIDGLQLQRCRNGNAFPVSCADGEWRVYDAEGTFLMLGRAEAGSMKTIKSFFEVSV